MRIVGTFDKENIGKRFSLYLEKNKIENSLEPQLDPKTKQTLFYLWVQDEDDIPQAEKFLEEFQKDPQNKKYDVAMSELPKAAKQLQEIPLSPRLATYKKESYFVTYFFLAICIGVYLLSMMQEMTIQKQANIKNVTLLTPIQITLLFDIPKAQIKLNEIIMKYGLDPQEKLKDAPSQALDELAQIEKIPMFKGLYDMALLKILNPSKPLDWSVPMFEKIKEGQVWRLLTPCFLHGGLLHILFNMIWLIVLGKQLEPRIKALRYFLFVIIVGVLSNIAQYLMGGPYFLGYSGVIMGMAGFIWMRQKIAPWEGYPLQKPIIYFIAFFILAMFALQLFSFLLQAFKAPFVFAPGIANSAHIAGAVVGIILARIPFFAWRTGER